MEFSFTLDLYNYNYLNDTNNLNNNIITEYNLKEIFINEYIANIDYYYILIKDNKSENWIKLNSKIFESYNIIN